jgi:hypothetical protein
VCGKHREEDQGLRPIWAKSPALRAGSTSQVMEHLPSKCKALSSNPSTAKKNVYLAVRKKRRSTGEEKKEVSSCL